MKKIIFMIIVLFSINALAKDIQKGTIEIAGNISMGASINEVKYDSTGNKIKTNSVSMSPSFLYYILPNIAIGTGLNFYYSKSEEEGYENKYISFGLLPKIKYNYSINKDLNFHMDAKLLMMRANFKFSDEISDETSLWKNMTGWGVGAGFDYFIKKDIALSSKLNYTNLNNSHYSTNNGNGDQTDISFFVGVVILFDNMIE